MTSVEEHIVTALEQKLEGINNTLRDHFSTKTEIGVLEGLSGIALFQFHYAELTNNGTYREWGHDTLLKIMNIINSGEFTYTFSSGITGAAWVIDHLNNNEFITLDDDELLNEIDHFIMAILNENIAIKYVDFMHGAMGNILYLLQRYEYAKDPEKKSIFASSIHSFLELLEDLAETEDDIIKWLSPVPLKNQQGYDLSLSHGMSSIIAMLCALSEHDAFRSKSNPLIEKSINYLLSCEFPESTDSVSLFPNWIPLNGDSDKNSRLGWCYGDFGIALAILKASQALNRPDLEEKAHNILKHTSQRQTEAQTQVVDAGLCHGAFGNAQIYNYLYHTTNEPLYKASANYWIDLGLKMDTHEEGYCGFKQHMGQGQWQSMLTLLEGISGIGLSIIDHLSDTPNTWDKCIQLH